MTEKANTLLEQMGFKDADMKSPMHDQIMLWLDKNMEPIIKARYIGKNLDWEIDIDGIWYQSPAQREIISKKVESQIPTLELELAPDDVAFDKHWEYVIDQEVHPRSKNRRVIGFADIVVDLFRPKLWFDEHGNFNTITWFPAGRLLFEVKTSIYSIGEVIRQINLYRTHLQCAPILVAPDSDWIKILQEQNIGFVPYFPFVEGDELFEWLKAFNQIYQLS